MNITYVVVPTAGNVRLPLGRLSPTRAGELRLEIAAQLLECHPEYHLAILGGRRRDPFESEAQVYYDYLCRKFKHILKSDRDVRLDSFKCTVQDMVEFAGELELEDGMLCALGLTSVAVDELILVTHPDHAELAAIPLRMFLPGVQVRCQESGEKPPYFLWMKGILLWVTRRDPAWRKLWSWPFRVATSFRENPKPI